MEKIRLHTVFKHVVLFVLAKMLIFSGLVFAHDTVVFLPSKSVSSEDGYYKAAKDFFSHRFRDREIIFYRSLSDVREYISTRHPLSVHLVVHSSNTKIDAPLFPDPLDGEGHTFLSDLSAHVSDLKSTRISYEGGASPVLFIWGCELPSHGEMAKGVARFLFPEGVLPHIKSYSGWVFFETDNVGTPDFFAAKSYSLVYPESAVPAAQDMRRDFMDSYPDVVTANQWLALLDRREANRDYPFSVSKEVEVRFLVPWSRLKGFSRLASFVRSDRDIIKSLDSIGLEVTSLSWELAKGRAKEDDALIIGKGIRISALFPGDEVDWMSHAVSNYMQ